MNLKSLCEKFKKDEITQDDFIAELEKIRAFSISDRFKLNVIDSAPFTMWASDKDNIIRYWECQCQNVYGYTAKEAIGQDFLKLFVAEAERNQADIDAKRIIAGEYSKDEFCNNIAEDKDSFGQTRRLMTNCFRIRDESTGEWLQAEIAIPTNMDRVEKKYDNIIANYNKLQALITKSKGDYKADIGVIRRHINNLQALAKRMINSRNKLTLTEKAIEQLDSIPNELEALKDEALNAMSKGMCLLKQAKSIDQFEQLEFNYSECKESYSNRIVEWQFILSDLSEELNQTAINKLNDLMQQKAAAIEECNHRANVPKQKLTKLLQIAYDYLGDPSYSSINTSVTSRIDQISAMISEITLRLSKATQDIFGCTDSTQVIAKSTDFYNYIELTCNQVNQLGL